MSDITTYLGNKVLRWLAGNAMPAPPDFLWLGVFNGDPKTSGIEVTASINGYGRVPVLLDEIAIGTDNAAVNVGDLSLGASENAVTATHVAIFDGVTGGNTLMSTALTGQPFSIDAGTIVEFLAGDLTFTIGS
jgi:hypothetical protein